MSELNQDNLPAGQDDGETLNFDMYGAVDGGDFRIFNVDPDQYHRKEVLERTGDVDITCRLEKVVHGAISDDSDRYATLIVMRWLFQAKAKSRISEATIRLQFDSDSRESDVEVEKMSFLNTYSLMPTTQDESVTKGGEASVGVEQFGKLGLTGKWEKTVATKTSDAITLSGGKRVVDNRPPDRIATWTLSENHSQPCGIPASLKVAVLITRNDLEKFRCKVHFECKTDLRSSLSGFFKKIPKDDPIIFQPDQNDKGTRPNKNVTYDDNELGKVNLDDLCDVTFRTVITDGQKTWK